MSIQEHAAALGAMLSGASVLRVSEPLERRTTLRVGGPADLYVEPASELDLSRVLGYCAEHQLPVLMLGRGSNLLVRDGGVRAVVICLVNTFFDRVEVSGMRLRCGAGAKLRVVANEARRHGLAGLEFLEGIPGSVGGALRMNAGAMGSWILDVTESVRFMDRAGQVQERPGRELPARYRGCPFFRDHVALAAVLKGEPASSEQISVRMRTLSQRRWETQPSQPSAGCIFKNPAGIPAGRLIEELKLKGTRIGGAAVSTLHGNFIVNEGGATARDVLALIDLIRARAQAERGIELETEVEIVGE